MKLQNRLLFAVFALLPLTATAASARITTDYNHKLNFGRGFAGAPHAPLGGHSGAFSGFDHGGVARNYSFRGQSSFGRGFSAGGGFHGGGFHGGGGGHR